MTKEAEKKEDKNCSVHGDKHEYNVQCQNYHSPEGWSQYMYRSVCGCGDVLHDWHV